MKLLSGFTLLFLFLLTLTLSSCGVVEGIFKAGMIWAFILIGLVVALVLYIMFKVRRK